MSTERIIFEDDDFSKFNFNLRYISMHRYEGDWASQPHTHHFSELFYILSGQGDFYIEDQILPVKSNDLVIINPHVEHTERTKTMAPMEYIVFGVDGLSFFFREDDPSAPKHYSSYSYSSSKNHMVDFTQTMLREFQEKKPGFDILCMGILQVLLVYISREQNLSIISPPSQKLSKECALAKRYIDTHYAQNITLDTLADITHINKYYLAHSFRSYMGKSPISYLTQKRISISTELLATTNLSIAQISSCTGFSSQSYFSQTFKKEMGISPQQYRKTHMKTAAPELLEG